MPKLVDVVLPLAAVSLVACGSSGENRAPSFEVARSPLQRERSPSLSEVELDTLAKAQANFAVDIFHAVATQSDQANKDVFLSPHSISIALGMTYAGARGDTATEMRKALRLELPDDRVHVGFDYLDLELASRGQSSQGSDGRPFRLNIANSLWGQKGSAFEVPFLDTLARDYGAGMNLVDFIGATEKARVTINHWVAEKTEDRIKEILPNGAVGVDTRMVLVNAVYFNAAWAKKFEPNATALAPFTKLDGSASQVSMMHETEAMGYAKGDGWEAVSMGYDADELALLTIIPASGMFARFESEMTGGQVLDIFAGLTTKTVNLSFPKVKLEGDYGLKAPLQSLGMNKAFLDADFSGISKTDGLYVDDVLHKTFLSIDENGTEAAAATAVTLKAGSAALDVVELKVDRPFITAIVDRKTRTLVFLGRILDPKF